MVIFAVVVGLLTLLAMGVVIFGPRLQRQPSELSRAAANVEVLRSELADLQRDCARGLLDASAFARAREDLQRRLVEEAAPSGSAAAPLRGSPRTVLFAVAGVLPLAAVALYGNFGQPRLIDEPTGSTALLASIEHATDAEQLPARLEAQVAAEPNDARAWVMLARLRMQRDQFDSAAQAYARALEVSPRVARDPLIWCEYADALGMAQRGRLAGKPREMIARALALEPLHPRALEMAGSAAYEANDYRGAARYWQQLLRQLPADSSDRAQLAAAITRAERRAQFSLPPA
jgi:cytochrome c-type biogenesis protein CcmH